MPETSTNPLLVLEGLPQFSSVSHEDIVPAIQHVIKLTEEQLEKIESSFSTTWDGLLKPLEDLDIPFEYSWQVVSHLLNVKNSDELRKQHQEVLPQIVQLGLRISQSKIIYNALLDLKNSGEWATLDKGQQRIIDAKIRTAKNAGVGLEGEAKERFLEISRELSQLGTTFSNNILDATKAFELIIKDKTHTEGWPSSLKHVAAQSYAQATEGATEADSEEGPWRITLDYPSFIPFMQHSRQREQRKTVYSAFITRASSGETNNSPLIDKILALRAEMATMLGYSSYAELSLDSKMAKSVSAVEKMINELREASYKVALQEHEALKSFALESGQTEPLMHWDIGFWSERLREKLFNFTDEELRPYFPLNRVIDGLFGLCTTLFGISFKQIEDEATIWHEDVQFYHVLSEEGAHIASFYLDPYSRPHEKRGGAWMDKCMDRRLVDGTVRPPVVHLCCNGTPPVGKTPSLMSFREVETLFHEFGHGLQGMLSTVDHTEAAGINGVEWDAVELASQFMENWCYHKPTLLGMTRHYQTGAPLPDELFEKIVAARTFRSGSMMMRQLLFGTVDIALYAHFESNAGNTPGDIYREFAKEMASLPPLPEDRFLCSFSHIFAGGYAAGYYSYKWAEVLSSDAYEAFEEAGLENTEAVQKLGRKYRDTILAMGGSQHPMDVFKAFRGRSPSPKALLRHSGLLDPVTNTIQSGIN